MNLPFGAGPNVDMNFRLVCTASPSLASTPPPSSLALTLIESNGWQTEPKASIFRYKSLELLLSGTGGAPMTKVYPPTMT